MLKRLKPLDKLDAVLFLQVNHLPHTPLLNRLFYTLTFIFTGGTAWFVVLGLNALRRRRSTFPLLRNAALPLLLAGLTVEHPIKKYFKRKRPFISIIQAIVIGKKPGTWSFPPDIRRPPSPGRGCSINPYRASKRCATCWQARWPSRASIWAITIPGT